MQGGRDDAYRCFDFVFAWLQTFQVRESRNQANGTVAAHAQVSYIVKEDHAGDARFVGRFDQDASD
jgi:hypothetical protein